MGGRSTCYAGCKLHGFVENGACLLFVLSHHASEGLCLSMFGVQEWSEDGAAGEFVDPEDISKHAHNDSVRQCVPAMGIGGVCTQETPGGQIADMALSTKLTC